MTKFFMSLLSKDLDRRKSSSDRNVLRRGLEYFGYVYSPRLKGIVKPEFNEFTSVIYKF